jgi:hypothetical protein
MLQGEQEGQTTTCPGQFIPDDLPNSFPAQWFLENMNVKKTKLQTPGCWLVIL